MQQRNDLPHYEGVQDSEVWRNCSKILGQFGSLNRRTSKKVHVALGLEMHAFVRSIPGLFLSRLENLCSAGFSGREAVNTNTYILYTNSTSIW